MNLSPATYKVLYDNVNITADVSDHIVSLSYTDKVEGESDEFEMKLEDADLLWQNAWYPKKGAKLQVQIEQDGLVLNCGAFTIDEIELSSDRSSGDTVSIRALAAPITKKLRTKRSTAHENKSLREIANTIASSNGLQVAGTIADITFNRITQYNKTDLSFLRELSQDYGYVFSIRDSTITFTSIFDLEARAHVLSIDKTDLLNWSLKDKIVEVYKKAHVKHHNSITNEIIEAAEDYDPGFDTSEDELELKSKAENKQQAGAKAKAGLHKKNSLGCTGSITIPGNTLIIAGNNIELTGLGNMSGVNHITSSTHTIERAAGYVTTAEVKRVAKISPSKNKPKTKKATGSAGAHISDITQNGNWIDTVNPFINVIK